MMLSIIFQLIVVQCLMWSTHTLIFQSPCGACSKSCGVYEEKRICGPSCPATCDTLNTNICCDVRCVPGCFCQDGYVLLSNSGPRRCVPLKDCPKPGVLEFANQTVIVYENMKIVMIVILRLNGTAGEITVQWRTVEGTAKQNEDFIPATGNLVFPEGVTFQTITIEIVDDNIRESDEVFTVVLSQPTNRAEINPRRPDGIIVVIKDNDMRYGHIEVELTTITVIENIGAVNVTLVRLDGTDGQIRMKYQTISSTAQEGIDYVPVTGDVIFEEGESRKVIPLVIIDDDTREPVENIRFQLFDPSVADDVLNYRSQSKRLETTIVIMDNDMRPGYVGIESTTIEVYENIGTVNITLNRLEGADGLIRIKYKTIEGTAQETTDFIPVAGEVIFNDGETKKIISLTIIDDDKRESVENIRLQLFDLSAADDVINFRKLDSPVETTIIIKDNDMKPGYIALPNPVLTVPESIGSFSINVVRLEGSDGQLRCRYRIVEVTASATSDYIANSGEILFEEGETLKTVVINILNDDVRESTESFRFELFEVSAAPDVINFRGMNGRSATIINIVDDDMRPGYVGIESTTIEVYENIGTVNIILNRLEGADGLIRIKYKTIEGTAQETTDFIPVAGEVIFNDGETKKIISLTIIDDDKRESVENIRLQLFDLSAADDVINFRKLDSPVETTIIIKDNDMKPGYIALPNPVLTVPESIGSFSINVVRLEGSDGQLRCRYRIVEVTASATSDYIANSGEILFEEGETLKTVVINILNDDVRESTESFRFELFEVSAAPDVINFRGMNGRSATIINIVDDDMTPGYFKFEQSKITVRENIQKIEVTILRLGGTDGILQLKYKTIDGTATKMSDYQSVAGDLVFKDGESKQTISIFILNDSERESVETFELQIYDISPGVGTINFRQREPRITTIIAILDDDERRGYAQMETATVKALENCGTVTIPVVRLEGSDGELRVPYKIIDVSAIAGSDYKAPLGEVVFKEGETRKIITIEVIDDPLREAIETFQVQLLDLESQVEQLSFRRTRARQSTLVSIIDNDAQPGFVQFERRSISIREDIGVVEIPVVRTDGTDGSLLVKYKAVIGTAMSLVDFSVIDGELLFNEGVDRLTIKIEIIDDRIKEPDETFTLIIFEPDNIQSRRIREITSLVVTIIDNDYFPGVFEFQNIRMSVPENARTLSITIIRKGGSDGLVTLQIRTRSGTATEGVDYNAPQLTIDFPDGITEKTLHIQIIDDDVKENDENFLIGIFNPSNGGSVGEVKLLTVVIVDDDEPSIIRFTRRTGSFRESDGIAEIPVIRENRLDRRVGVHWKTEDQTARANEDYREVSDSLLIFEPNERTKTIRIVILDDSRFEDNELFDVVLWDPSEGAALGIPSRYTVELADNDAKASSLPPLPSVSNNLQIYFPLQNIRVSENAGEVRITIVRSGPVSPVTVRLQTADGTAIGGKDYRRTRGPVTFEEGDIEITIAVRIIDDNEVEPDKSFTVQLFNPSAGIIPFGLNVVTITIEDDDGDLAFRRDTGSTANQRPAAKPNPGSGGPFLLTKCPSHLILKTCANTCPPTCNSIFGKAPCASGAGCIRGCFCPDGFVKESESSERCVRPSQCSNSRPPCSKCAGSSSGLF